MVKTPRTRHSKTKREPLTIDLDADAVKREAAKPSEPASQSSTKPAEEKKPETAGPAADPKVNPSVSTEKSSSFGRTSKPDDKPKEAAAPKQAQAVQPGKSGAGSALAAGAAGGVVALALAAGLQWAGILPGLQPAREAADPAVETLRQELSNLQETIQEQQNLLAANGDNNTGEALADAATRADAQETRIAELNEKLSQVSELIASGGAGEAAGLEALSSRLRDMESQVRTLAATEGSPDDAEALESRFAGVEKNVEAASQATSANAEKLTTLSGQVDTLSTRVNERDETPRMALVIAASSLKSAVERGTPFASELDTYAAIAPDAEALDPLREFAGTGVPSRAALAAEAPKAASRMVAAMDRSTADEGGLVDRLMSSARSLVVVRPVGSVEGEGVAAIAARMEAAVIGDDYDKALAEYATLPAEAKAAADGFAKMLGARLAADKALDKALSDALKGA